jgi:hypothetical protein
MPTTENSFAIPISRPTIETELYVHSELRALRRAIKSACKVATAETASAVLDAIEAQTRACRVSLAQEFERGDAATKAGTP